MKRVLPSMVLLLVLLFPAHAQADSPIYTGLLWDTAPAVAYNSKSREFLVVWNIYDWTKPLPDPGFFGPIMGQRIKESGAMIGQAFQIISDGVLPDVVYNAAKNEYLVVAERSFNTEGQRVSALGLPIGGPTILLTNARYPRVVYNSLAQNYLVTGVWLTDTGSGGCDMQLSAVRVDGNGQSLGTKSLVADRTNDSCDYIRRYAIAYAPIVSANTPQGRYLLSCIVLGGLSLSMLNSQGQLMQTLCNYGPTNCEPSIPFQNTKVGLAVNIDVTYGQVNENDVFFLVWGDRSNEVDGQQWTGIWAGIVDAEKGMYYKEEAVQNDVFPISYQYSHYSTDEYATDWNPVVAYNPAGDRFVVAWRETPGTDSRDLTNVNHIRANTSNGYRIPPLQNLVISSTSGSEDPKLPCVACSSVEADCLIVWEDHRNFFGIGDIYGSLASALPPCPQCTGDPVVLTNVTFPAGTACDCTAATSITVGNGTTVKNGATVRFISPKVNVQSGAKFEAGAAVRIKQP